MKGADLDWSHSANSSPMKRPTRGRRLHAAVLRIVIERLDNGLPIIWPEIAREAGYRQPICLHLLLTKDSLLRRVLLRAVTRIGYPADKLNLPIRKRIRLTLEVEQEILGHLDAGRSPAFISKNFGCAEETIRKIRVRRDQGIERVHPLRHAWEHRV